MPTNTTCLHFLLSVLLAAVYETRIFRAARREILPVFDLMLQHLKTEELHVVVTDGRKTAKQKHSQDRRVNTVLRKHGHGTRKRAEPGLLPETLHVTSEG